MQEYPGRKRPASRRRRAGGRREAAGPRRPAPPSLRWFTRKRGAEEGGNRKSRRGWRWSTDRWDNLRPSTRDEGARHGSKSLSSWRHEDLGRKLSYYYATYLPCDWRNTRPHMTSLCGFVACVRGKQKCKTCRQNNFIARTIHVKSANQRHPRRPQRPVTSVKYAKRTRVSSPPPSNVEGQRGPASCIIILSRKIKNFCMRQYNANRWEISKLHTHISRKSTRWAEELMNML